MRVLKIIFKSRKGEGYIDVVVKVFVAVLTMVLLMNVYQVLMSKYKLNTFVSELCREAEISGRVGSEVNIKFQKLKEQTGIEPQVLWSKTGDIQLNEEVTLILNDKVDIGFFHFGSFPILLTAKATGKSEVYHK